MPAFYFLKRFFIDKNLIKFKVKKSFSKYNNMKISPQNILFLTAIHGDEPIGVEVMQRLEREGLKPNWIIGNEKAFKKGKRFIEVDLNRVAPGKRKSKKYELSRAYQILKIAKKYKCVIDIHETVSNTGIFLIVTKARISNLQLSLALPFKRVVIWEGKNPKKGPITQFLPYSLGIECGPKNSKKNRERLFQVFKKIVIEGIKIPTSLKVERKDWYEVFGKIPKSTFKASNDIKLKDFEKTTIKKETFYPLLVGQYPEILCYKMRKIDPKKIKNILKRR